jgi:hypothetical protein
LRYLAKERGDLKRLRRDLCSAFGKGRAGFDAYQSMTAKEFAMALNEAGFRDAGVEVKVYDVNNGAKSTVSFKPHETPSTRPVRQIMEALKRTFPSIDEHELYSDPGPDAIKLSDALLRTCRFTALVEVARDSRSSLLSP